MSGQVTIVGAGLAGLSATLALAEQGVRVTLVSRQPSERSQSVMAEGGINAALDLMGEHDRPELHFADTMRSADGLADPNAVWGLAQSAPGIVRDLVRLGVPFQVEHGKMIQRAFGGQQKRRTAYAKSSTGKVLVSALVDEVRRYEERGLVKRLAHHELVGLAVEEGRCAGVAVRDAFTGKTSLLGAPVILCAGGLSGIFGPRTTGTTVNDGSVAALCLAADVELADLEMVQYHPTTVPIPGKRMLVSEAARGEGGRLFALRDGKPWYFMEERYPELGNLMPRDVVSREEAAVLADPRCGGQVFLDMRGLSRHVWRTRLSDLRDECVHYLGIDPAKRPFPVEPGIHYSMGGIRVDEDHRTNVEGLYAAGECACQYHGANRLGGNSLLGAIYGGRVAAASVLSAPADAALGASPSTRAFVVMHTGERGLSSDVETLHAVQELLASSMGIIRTGEALAEAERKLAELEPCAQVMLAQALVASALARQESRGAHWREDFPQKAEGPARQTVTRLEQGRPVVSLAELPKAREDVPALGGGSWTS